MAKIYVKWILDPNKNFTIDDVPQRWRAQVEAMLAEAEQVAEENAEYATYEDIFGAEE